MKLAAVIFSSVLLSVPSFAQNGVRSGLSKAKYQLLEAAPEREKNPLVYFGLNTLPVGAGAAVAAPVFPIEAGIRVVGGLSVGPLATFSGRFTYDEADFKLSGIGAHVTYNFGRSAITDGFYLQGFYQRYTLDATKMSTLSMEGMQIPFPLEGSMPADSFGGGIGYQWVWKSGLRLNAAVKVMVLKSDSSSMLLMGMNRDELQQLGSAMNGESVDVPLMKDESAIIPMPELTIGWAI